MFPNIQNLVTFQFYKQKENRQCRTPLLHRIINFNLGQRELVRFYVPHYEPAIPSLGSRGRLLIQNVQRITERREVEDRILWLL